MATRFHRLMPKHPLAVFFLMMLTSLIFGLSSYNLFFLVQANFSLVFNNGVMALIDGALLQLLTLMFYGIISLSAYLVFKVCEKLLVETLTPRK